MSATRRRRDWGASCSAGRKPSCSTTRRCSRDPRTPGSCPRGRGPDMTRRFFTTKVIRGLLTIWLIVTFTFVALNLSGDPIEALVGDQASPAVIAHYRAKFGLDRPL